MQILNLFKHYLNKGKKFDFGKSDNLMVNQFLDLNFVQMAEFTHLKEHQKSRFFTKLLKLSNYTNLTLDFLLNASGLLSQTNEVSSKAK